MKLPETVDRRVFWTWAVPLVIAHVALSVAVRAGVNGMGGADTIALIALALLIARRFRDIGWSGWIGGSFVIGTMLVVPLLVVAYAITNDLPPAQFIALMNPVGLVVASANLVLLVVAGCVQGKGLVAPGPAVDALQSPDEGSPSPAPAKSREPNLVVIGSAAVVAVAVIGAAVFALLPHQHAAQASMSSPVPSSSPSVRPGTNQIGTNGLTKDTNDFLRQLSQQPHGLPNR
ncbi:hypothetical protein UP10_28765 [Bradyrhizobium sp. LTSPM299]|uniref:hypothetical protein n=1 Tax=Bradyrhizobium sp. LTSPM299 TaxID=1619233 RepID=UPI0005CA86DD|nr:hypothetical protein [Bradyrhizobium sp. LTSPM299]KJC57442.1 hypothetical protein UP10_28765 [Bradyrhizobium sp. LTSPM299]